MRRVQVGSYSKKSNTLSRKANLANKAKKRKSLQNEDPVTKRTSKRSKPENKGTKKSKFKKLILFLIVFAIISFSGFGYWRFQALQDRVQRFDADGNLITCANILNPNCWTEAFKPQLKQTNGLTNVLIVGLDTRETSDSLKNTDSIIIASFDHTTEKTMLISIPRDFFVAEYGYKINAVYSLTGSNSPKNPFKGLKNVITDITDLPIHYTATIRFEGVIDGINELGGIEVCPKDSFRAQYPDDDPAPGASHWLYYDFNEGCQKVDGEHALVYARFRYLASGPSYLASDFSRARRQQEVIEALKDNALGMDLSIGERADTYWTLLKTFKDSISVDISFEDILAGLAFIDSADQDPINVVLDPLFGGTINDIIYENGGSSAGYIIEPRDNTYQEIKDHLAFIRENGDIYKESPNILVRNMSGEYIGTDHTTTKLRDEELNRLYSGFNYITDAKTTQFKGIKVFDLSNGKKPFTIELILKYFGLTNVSKQAPSNFGFSQSNYGEDIVILVGPPKLESTPVVTTTVPAE